MVPGKVVGWRLHIEFCIQLQRVIGPDGFWWMLLTWGVTTLYL
jgi:hypothetical protein